MRRVPREQRRSRGYRLAVQAWPSRFFDYLRDLLSRLGLLTGVGIETQFFCMDAAGFLNFSRSQIKHQLLNRSTGCLEEAPLIQAASNNSLTHCLSSGVIQVSYAE